MSKGKFTDIFVCRPVLATVISLMIFVLGIKAILDLEVRQYPKMSNTVITVQTLYPGASSDLVEGFITKILEQSIANSEGIDYMSSSSIEGQSTITINVKLNFDPTTAFTDVISNVQAQQNNLPRDAQLPVITKSTGDQAALLYISFNSDKMSAEQITDYITRVVQPKISSVDGVAQAEILGGKTFSMRVWFDTKKLAAFNITAADAVNALLANNFQAAAGSIKGYFYTFYNTAQTDLHDANAFANIVIKKQNGTLIRIKDIAKVELGSENYDASVYFNGSKAIFVAVTQTPTANPLTVISNVKKLLPQLEEVYPPTLRSKVVYDATQYISESIVDVMKTIVEAAVIVLIVIFLFLGSFRSVMIPIVTIPLSLIGVCFFMLMMGYSINLLTLLAMVLAIGLVVDDAIVVVENVHRHIEEGMTPFTAAIKGAREIATPVIAMTITLAAVYAPLGFMGGLTGALFKEFAFTLAGSVIVSGIIALTLSPMMCSKFLTEKLGESRYEKFLEKISFRFTNFYQQKLHNTLNFRPVVLVFAFTVLVSCYFLYTNTTSELAPDEDQGVLLVSGTAPEYANIDYLDQYGKAFNEAYQKVPATEDYFVVNGSGSTNNSVFGATILKTWADRTQSQDEAEKMLQPLLNTIAGVRVVTFPLASLPGGGSGLPIQFELVSVNSLESIYPVAEKILNEAKKSGLFIYMEDTLNFTKPQLIVNINRNKAGDLGILMQDIGSALAYYFGGNYINRFSIEGQSYKVIPQALRTFRLGFNDINYIYVKTASGTLVPLSTVVTLTTKGIPNARSHFQQLNSATVQGVMTPGFTTGDGLDFLMKTAKKYMPHGMIYDFGGQSRQYIQEGSALLVTFFLSIIIIFLVLAAQFESFRGPLVILVSVPMSICGALIFLNLGFATINIYTQIGLITLVGLISKHGILMVEFANQLQRTQGLSVRDAIERAAAVRIRPILMTTAAMVLGVFPLVIATGAGAVSRFNIGLVITTGMLIGTLFTLFVVPTMYTLIAEKFKPLQTAEEI